MRKSIFLIFMISVLSAFLSSCSFFEKNIEENNYSYLGFYSEPGDIITELSGKDGSREHFMLGLTYKKKQIYEKAIIHFAKQRF